MTTTVITQQQPVRSVASPVRRRRARVGAVGAAVVASSVLYLGARLAGTDFALTDPGKTEAHALILPEIAVFALVFSLLGWGTLALLERLTTRARVVWAGLAAGVLMLSFVPIVIEQATVDTKLMLALIHVAVAVALFSMLRRADRRA